MSLLLECFKEYKELHQAYNNTAVVFGLFRHIGPKSQHFLMTFLFIDTMDERNAATFAQTPQEAEEALQELKTLGFFKSTNGSITLNNHIKDQIKHMLYNPIPCTLRTKSKPDKRKPLPDKIITSTQNNWRKLIDFLIGIGSPPSIGVLRLLIRSGLISQENLEFSRTSECFRFLLKPPNTQVLYLLKQMLSDSSEKVKTSIFLFNLSISTPEKDYSTKDTNKGVIDDLNELGIIYKHNSKSKRYYIAPIMIGLLTDSPKPVPITDKFLVIETNFRIYAYTQSELNIVLLSYFLKLEYRLPGMIVASLTRESACNAFKEGLHAQQIIDFLSNHSEKLPENVYDQLYLWEKERKRISDYDSIMLDEFADVSLYRSTLNYAQGCGAYLWDSFDRRVIILHKDKAQPVLKYLQSLDRIVS